MFIKASKVRKRFKEAGKQISKDGFAEIDAKVDALIRKLCNSFNGHHKRITKKIVETCNL